MTFLGRLRRRWRGARNESQGWEVRRAILGSLPVGNERRERHRLWRVLLWSGITLLLLQIESGVLVHLHHQAIRVDIAAILLAFVAFELGVIEGSLAAFAIGYVADLFVLGPPGLCRFLAVAIWAAVHLFPQPLSDSGWLGSLVRTFGISALFQLGILGAETLIRLPSEAPGTIAWMSVVPVAMLTALFAVPIHRFLSRLDRMTSGPLATNER